MAAQALVGITGTVSGLPSGSKVVSAAMASQTPVGATTEVTLGNGDNVIAVPAGSTGCLIVPPAANAAVTTLKGAAGDTGVVLSPNTFSFLSWATGAAPASFILNSAGAQTASTEVSFF